MDVSGVSCWSAGPDSAGGSGTAPVLQPAGGHPDLQEHGQRRCGNRSGCPPIHRSERTLGPHRFFTAPLFPGASLFWGTEPDPSLHQEEQQSPASPPSPSPSSSPSPSASSHDRSVTRLVGGAEEGDDTGRAAPRSSGPHRLDETPETCSCGETSRS